MHKRVPKCTCDTLSVVWDSAWLVDMRDTMGKENKHCRVIIMCVGACMRKHICMRA
jgi:hypothetical protein